MVNNKVNKNRIILLIIAVILIISIVSVFVYILVPKTDEIIYEIRYEGIKGEGVIFRDESFIDLSQYEKTLFNNVVDGQFVVAGTNIATGYKKGYIKSSLEKLIETEKNIVTYQNQNIITEFDDKKIRDYDFEIDVIIKKMSEANENYIELYCEICDLIMARQTYIRNTYNTENNDYLQGLYADEISLTESLKSWCDTFDAHDDGYIGFYCDGYEKEFGIENVQNYSCKDVTNLMKEEYENNLYGYKIVKDNKWYSLVVVEDASKFAAGNSYPVYIGNETEWEEGYLEEIKEDKSGYLLVFSFNDNVEKYSDMRITDFFVGQRIEGFCVESEFVENDSIFIENNDQKIRIQVEVLYHDEDIAIFNTDEQLQVGQKVYK